MTKSVMQQPRPVECSVRFATRSSRRTRFCGKSSCSKSSEFAVAAWNPYQKYDIEILELVQHRATKVANGMGHLSYKERFDRVGLLKLSDKRVRSDLLQQFKIAKELDIVRWSRELTVVSGRAS